MTRTTLRRFLARWTMPTVFAVAIASGVGQIHAMEISSSRPITILKASGGGMPIYLSGKYLAKHLARLSARRVTIAKEPVPGGLTVHVGRTPFVEKRFGKRLDAMPSHESFIIEAEGETLVLAGKGPAGTLNAAVIFLREHCGVEHYIPGELGTVYSKPAPIILPVIHYAHTPSLKHRVLYAAARDKHEGNYVQEWIHFQNRAISVQFSHNLVNLLRPTKYAKTHPEYFAEVNGRRRLFSKDVGSGWQPCMTNAEGIRVVAEEIIRQFDADPNRLSVSIGVNDGGNYCECKNCKPLWVEGPKKRGQCARLFYTYANRIAEIVARKYPDRILGCLAYSSAGSPPDGLDLHPMVMPFVTLASEGCINDELWREHIKAEIDQVARNSKSFGVYEYLHGAGMYIPSFFDERLAKTLKYAYSKGCRAIYLETGPIWGMDVYKHALAMRILWNPKLDVKAWKAKFFKDFYGTAAPAMERYFARCHKAQRSVERIGMILHKREEQMNLFSEEALTDCDAALRDAAKTATDEASLRRIRMTQRAFAGTLAMGRRHWAGTKAMAMLDRRAPTADVIATLAPVAGPEFDYRLLYKLSSADDPYIASIKPDDGSVRMEAAYTEARARLFTGILNDVARDVRRRKNVVAADAALRKVRQTFANIRAANSDRLMLDALKIGSCVARATKAKTPPTLDGTLDDKAWSRAEPIRGFVEYGTGAPSRFPTTARIARAGGNLFMALDCKQPGNVFWSTVDVRDGSVWTNDSVEVFFNKPGETDPDALIQVIVNVNGAIFDRKGPDDKWNGAFQVATSRGKNGWCLELAMPLAMLKDYIVDGACHINIARNKQRVKDVRGVLKWNHYDEISSWFPSFKGNANLLSRGWLLLD